MSKPEVSICIPTFELGGRGVPMLTRLLVSIAQQLTYFNDFEVVISDHSKNDAIFKVYEAWNKIFPMIYVQNTRSRGSCEGNLNTAILNANGRLIKPMLQDDYFLMDNSLRRLTEVLQKDDEWSAGGCMHCKEDDTVNLFRAHYPRWVPDRSIALGANLIGSPSVVLYPRKLKNHLFDENLLLFMDCELYYRIGLEIGAPSCIPEPLHVIRTRHDSISDSQITDDIRGEEYRYVISKMDQDGKTLDKFPILFERAQRLNLRQ